MAKRSVSHKQAGTVLGLAAAAVSGPRRRTHGSAEDGLVMTAKLWSTIAGIEITPHQAALMLAANKMARSLSGDKGHVDHYADGAGYLSLAWPLARGARR